MKLSWEAIGCTAMAVSVVVLVWLVIIFVVTHWNQLPAIIQGM